MSREKSRKKPVAPGEEIATGPVQLGRRSRRLRLRAAWMYHVEEMTQSAIAEVLGIGRITVVRLLSDAHAFHEVRISLSRDIAELTALEMALERAFGIGEAIVAPVSGPEGDPTVPIGAATGQYISEALRPGMKIGVGWGKTLISALPYIAEKPVAGLSVVSLLGGIAKAWQYNPTDFAWQFSRLLQADCFLIPAPAVVDSVETKRALIERCGLDEIFELGRSLDTVILSVGGMTTDTTSFRFGMFSEEERRSLLEAGAVGDLLYNFIDITGKPVDHPLNSRVMAMPLENIAATPDRVLTSGGAAKTDVLVAAIRLVRPTVLITDELTAAAALKAVGATPRVPASA